jgi:hypothetical protein
MKEPSHHGEPVTDDVVKQVRDLAKGNTPTRVIALKVGRTEDSVRSIAKDNGISLMPPNQSPYGSSK